MSKLNKEYFEQSMGSWWPYFEKFYDSGGFDRIYSVIGSQVNAGAKVAPASQNVFRCFRETPFDKVICVIVSYCPYHTFKGNTPVADGLAFSCSITNRIQPSLKVIYEAIHRNFYPEAEAIPMNPSLEYLAKQGVLLYNVALTTLKDAPGSHISLWEPFSEYFFGKVMDKRQGVAYIFLGKDASKFVKYITPITHGPYIVLEHPAYIARSGLRLDMNGKMKEINDYIKSTWNVEISWADGSYPVKSPKKK